MIAQLDDGRTVFYAVTGVGPDTLIILHGAASDADTMIPLATELSSAFRTVTMDRLGYRRSSRLQRTTTLEEQAAAVDAVRQGCTNEAVWVCGHSSGGNVAAGYATLYPANVRGLVLIEPPMYALYTRESMPPVIQMMKEEIVPLFEAGDIAEGIRRFTGHLEIPPETWAALAREGHGKNAAENWAPLQYEFEFALEWPRSSLDLQNLTHPVLVIEGDRTSQVLKGASRLLMRILPHAKRLVLPNCDHLAPIVHPELVARRIIEFIARHLSPSEAG